MNKALSADPDDQSWVPRIQWVEWENYSYKLSSDPYVHTMVHAYLHIQNQ